jgi:RHH-type proline utilization regulon transcriptional repressor/proline dehydrogenase/delta 1-pyrroline-5-carboxylate dehydrogenase
MRLFRQSSRDKNQTVDRSASSPLEAATLRIGLELLEAARKNKAGIFSNSYWADGLMSWALGDPAFKTQLFRFVDVFPTLHTPEQVHEYLVEYLTQPGVRVPAALSVGLKAGGLLKGTMTRTVSSQIQGMAAKFIAGEDAESALPALRKLWDEGVAFSVDLLGEACVGQTEAEIYQKRYLDLIETLSKAVAQWPANPRLDSDHIGPMPRANVSIKISSLYAKTNPIDFQGSLAGLYAAVKPLLEKAGACGVFVNFDMEQSWLKDLTIALFQKCCEEIQFEGGLAMQAYLRSGEEDAKNLIAWAKAKNKRVAVRLIKGAYWDFETIHAEQQGWPSPVWSTKPQTDACFERMTELFVKAAPRKKGDSGISLALGSHNVRSIAHAMAMLEQNDLPPAALELQMLRGMADELKRACIERGLRVREYIPVGEMIPGMAYLVRRLLENTSNESWLKAGFADNAAADVLLADPAAMAKEAPEVAPAQRHRLSVGVDELDNGKPFFTEPWRNFSVKSQRDAYGAAVAKATVPNVPSTATVEEASRAVAVAESAFPAWRDRPVFERSKLLLVAAAKMREVRDDLSGVMVREAGKPWAEADGDVCEAIDFCEYYARQAVSLFVPQRLGRFTGELDEVVHESRGVCVVISPWNFPLAICCGMTVAALVTGNTVVLKPAEQTTGIAMRLCEALWAAGVPRDVLQLVAGQGETVGAALVRDPRVATIAFTGSSAVGLDILKVAGQVLPGQPFVKRVVCEMGGKNAVIIDDTADLDEAVLGVRQSAFGFAGQKCSAASRVVALDSVHDAFVRRLVDATGSLVVGDPTRPGTDVGPVIDNDAAKKVQSYIDWGNAHAKLAFAGTVPAGLESVGKPFVAPHIFTDVQPTDRLAQEEIFGPVLSVIRASDFDNALAIANGVPLKLTGGVFTRRPAHIDRTRKEFRVGNLYINRGITGALVGRQPFGGMGLSGIGAQAGGADYLRQFVNARAICENTLRRGFAPGD